MLKKAGVLTVEINEEKLNEIVKSEVKAHLNNSHKLNKIFYTMKDLSYLTGLSEGSIYKYIFPDPHLPKRKIGNKWLFKAEQTDTFLNNWIDQFPDQ